MRLSDSRRFREAMRERNAEVMVEQLAERVTIDGVVLSYAAVRELLTWAFDQGMAEARLREVERAEEAGRASA